MKTQILATAVLACSINVATANDSLINASDKVIFPAVRILDIDSDLLMTSLVLNKKGYYAATFKDIHGKNYEAHITYFPELHWKWEFRFIGGRTFSRWEFKDLSDVLGF